jgi:hypothetical protein
MNIYDYILIGIIGIGAGLACYAILKNRKNGTCIGCSGSCTNCGKRKSY